MRRSVSLLVGLIALLSLAGPAAAAQPYAPNGPTVSVSNSTVTQTGIVTVNVSGFAPGTQVTFQFFSTPITVGTAVADASGSASLTFQLPAGTSPGVHTVVATGGGVSGSVSLVVTGTNENAGPGSGGGSRPTSPTSGNGLPFTGSNVAVLALAGLLLMGAGAFALARGRRDHSTL